MLLSYGCNSNLSASYYSSLVGPDIRPSFGTGRDGRRDNMTNAMARENDKLLHTSVDILMSCFVASAPISPAGPTKRGSCNQSLYYSCCSCGGVQVAFYGDNLFVNQIIPPCSYIIRGIESRIRKIPSFCLLPRCQHRLAITR